MTYSQPSSKLLHFEFQVSWLALLSRPFKPQLQNVGFSPRTPFGSEGFSSTTFDQISLSQQLSIDPLSGFPLLSPIN